MRAPGSAARLLGRDTELAALGEAVERAVSGRLSVVAVEGEAGIGKTSLLDAALDVARRRGLPVVTGRAEELERNRPFGVWVDALRLASTSADPRRAAIAALLAARPGSDGPITVSSDPGLQFQAVDAIVDLIEDLAHEGPLVIGLDDLQWADPAGLLTLTALVRRLTHVPVAVLSCRRPTPRGRQLQRALDYLDDAGAVTVRLARLPNRAVHDLVTEILAAPPGAELLAEVADAGGNPLFVTELLAALVGENAIRLRDGRAEVSAASLPPSLRLTILRHLSFLPDDTLAALQPASVLGTSFTVDDLATITERSVLALSGPLGPAMTAQVLVEAGDRLRFRHDLIHDAVYADIPQSVRIGLHREAGRRLARAGAPAGQVAEHLSRGALPGDNAAVDWLVRAAREVAARSPGAAAELLGRAVELADPTDRDRLLVEQAGSLSWAGDAVEAALSCRDVLARDPAPRIAGLARICLARSLIAQGRMSDALRELECLPPAGPLTAGELGAARGWASMARLSTGDLAGAAAAACEAVGTAGEPAAVSLARTCLAVVAELRGQPGRALEIVDEAVADADRSPGGVGHRYPVHVARGHILLELDRLPDARATLLTGRARSEDLGTRWALTSFEVFLAVERFLAGEWDDALAGVETGLALAEETGERYSLVLAHSVTALIALHRDDLRRATTASELALRELAASGPRFRSHWAPWVQAQLLEASGDDGRAVATLADAWDDCTRSGLAIEYPVLGPDLVRLTLAAGERERAEQVTEALCEVTRSHDAPSRTGAALRCQGLLAADPEPLLAAVAAYAGAARPLELALTAEDAAALLAARGDTDTACTLLQRAVTAFEGLHAARGVARTEATLRELGVRRGRRGPRARPRTGWDSLTPTERRVVALVAEGLSNPQIGERLYLSRRTVQTHVGHVFGKLGLSSRTELAAAAAREGRR